MSLYILQEIQRDFNTNESDLYESEYFVKIIFNYQFICQLILYAMKLWISFEWDKFRKIIIGLTPPRLV